MIFYRYNAMFYADGACSIQMEEYTMLRETPKGYWIIPDWYDNFPDAIKEEHKKWVPKKSKKRFAYPTVDEAWISFKARSKMRKIYAERKRQEANIVLYEIRKIEQNEQV